MKILVVRLSSLGDVVLTAPVYSALRERFPQATLLSVVKKAYADVLTANVAIDHVFTLAPGESLIALIRRIRAAKVDIVIDLHANLRSRLISFFSGAPKKIRYRKAALSRRLFVGWRLPSRALEHHTLDRYLDTLGELGVPMIPASPDSILLIQTAFLGDAVLTIPLVSAIRDKFPKAALSVLCTPEVAEVFRSHPATPEILLFDKRGDHRSLRARWRLSRTLRARHFELAIIPHRSFTSAALAALAGIPRRVGFSRSQGRWLLSHLVPFQWGVHDVERNLALLEPLGVPPPSGKLWMRPDPETQSLIQQRLKEAGIGPTDPVLGINAGSVWATKRWLPEGFAAVADRAIRDGMKVIFVGGTKDEPSVHAVTGRMTEKALNWAGKTSLKELIAVIARTNVFLTNDSGPMHIAAACGIPVVALFGPTTKELGFFPYGAGHKVIEKNLPCRPCGLHGHERCPLGHFECMKSINADEVYAAVKEKR